MLWFVTKPAPSSIPFEHRITFTSRHLHHRPCIFHSKPGWLWSEYLNEDVSSRKSCLNILDWFNHRVTESGKQQRGLMQVNLFITAMQFKIIQSQSRKQAS